MYLFLIKKIRKVYLLEGKTFVHECIDKCKINFRKAQIETGSPRKLFRN